MFAKLLQYVLFALVAVSPALAGTRVLKPEDRIVFVGDSITGQGGSSRAGFVHLIGDALKDVWPESRLTLLALGGSGQSVGSWINVEKSSRTTDRALDVPGVMVKTTLDQPADVLVVMLGMNDVLYPYVSDKPADVEAWGARYEALLHSLRERLHPRVVALATVTMATEDPDSPKNRLAALLNERVAKLADEQGCMLLSTNAAVQEMLRTGRTWRPDFHVTTDFVHPNPAGHVAIATAMLSGLHEDAAAKALHEKHLPALRGKYDDLAISYTVRPVVKVPAEMLQAFEIDYTVNRRPAESKSPVRVTLAAPQGWHIEPTVMENVAGTFRVTGNPDRLQNDLRIDARSGTAHQSAEVQIPAPWLVAVDVANRGVWSGPSFTPEKGELPSDAAVSRGAMDAIPPSIEPTQLPLVWRRTFASVNFTGGNSPTSIDFWSLSIGRTFDTAYALRWVYSPQARPIRVQQSTRAFAGQCGLTTWLNGRQVYRGMITGEPGKSAVVPAELKAGWNCVAIKSNHLAWLWQVEISLLGAAEEKLDDLRYSTTPPEAATKWIAH